MKVSVELLRWQDGDQPTVLHRFSHESHSLETVAAALQCVVNSNILDSREIPLRPDGYRIITEGGTELYGWPDSTND